MQKFKIPTIVTVILSVALATTLASCSVANKVGEDMGIGLPGNVIDQDADIALNYLYNNSAAAAKLSKTAKGVLIFPRILKAGVGVGVHRGEGALRQNGMTTAYYKTSAASYGLQIGAQSFGYAMFFMDDAGLKYMQNSNGWEVGVGPSVVIVDAGMAKTLLTSLSNAPKDSIYVFTFNQKGLMAGAGIQGSKITRIMPQQ